MDIRDPKTPPAPVQAKDLVGNVHFLPLSKSEPPLPSGKPEKPEKLEQGLLDKLWIKMTEMYGHRWTANFGVLADPDHSWASVLKGLTKEQLANGLNALVDKPEEFDWPPPANVFRSMCLQVKGLPTEAQAWHEALSGTYSHKAVQIAAEATSTFDLRAGKPGDKALRQRFERNYAIVVSRAQRGLPLEGGIAKGIGHDSARPREDIQLEHSRKEAEALVIAQGIPTSGAAARQLLMARFKKPTESRT